MSNVPETAIPRLLDLARWAPSGDNTQPWRFEIQSRDRFVVHGFDTRNHCVYDLDGHPSQMAIGALLETLSIGATEQGLSLCARFRADFPETQPTFEVSLHLAEHQAPDPLLVAIPRRSVYRRPLSTAPIPEQLKASLADCLPPGYSLAWYESWRDRWRLAGLMFANAKLRLTMREAFEVHRAIIDWGQRFSDAHVPDQALGVDAATLKLMRWAMQDWARVQFLNRWMAGTLAPRIQMDLLPSLLCGAHVAIVSNHEPRTVPQYVDAGRCIQRFWLKACLLGLQHQPEMTPLIFSRYVRNSTSFTSNLRAASLARKLSDHSSAILGANLPRTVWLGRLGYGPNAASRSQRLSLAQLLQRN